MSQQKEMENLGVSSSSDRPAPPTYDYAVRTRDNNSRPQIETDLDTLSVGSESEEKTRNFLTTLRQRQQMERNQEVSSSTNSIPFADQSSDDEGKTGASAAVAKLHRDVDDERHKAILDKNRETTEEIRRQNTPSANLDEIEMMIVGDQRDSNTAMLRFRGANKRGQDVRDDENRSSAHERTSSGGESFVTARTAATEGSARSNDSDLTNRTALRYRDQWLLLAPLETNHFQLDGRRKPARPGTYVPEADVIFLGAVNRTDGSSDNMLQQFEESRTDGRDGRSVEEGESHEPKTCDWPHPLLTRIATKWVEMSKTKRLILGGVVLFLGILLLVTLLPASFVYVEYHEYALVRNKWTSAVDYSRVLDSGCYLMAPQDELVRLSATAHIVEMRLGIMNKESFNIKLEFALQYFLKRDEVPTIYRMYHFEYDRTIRNVINSTVKNNAISFTMDDYRLQRQAVERAIFEKLQYALSGDCCSSNCRDSRLVNCTCNPNPDTCFKGKHVELRYFQMGEVAVPDEVMEKYTKRILAQINAEREFSIQEKALVEKETTFQVQQLLNQATEKKEAAKAEAYRISVLADAQRDKVIQSNYSIALSRMFKNSGVTDEEAKLSFIYLKTLMEKRNNLLAFNYEQSILLTP